MNLDLTDSLVGIELTPEGTVNPREKEFVHKKERITVLQDPVRLRILQILKEGIDDTLTEEEVNEETGERIIRQRIIKRHALSVNDIIKASKAYEASDHLTKNQIYHHLPRLLEANFILKHGIITKGKRTTDYYRRTAHSFVTFGMHYGFEGFRKALKEETKEAFSSFNLNLTREDEKELLGLMADNELMRLKGMEIVESLVKSDVTDSKQIELFDWFLWLYATGKTEFLQMLERMRNIVFKEPTL